MWWFDRVTEKKGKRVRWLEEKKEERVCAREAGVSVLVQRESEAMFGC